MEQEYYTLDKNSNKYKIISKILLIATPILLAIVLLDTIIFSDKVQRVLHYLDMIELISFFILSIFLMRHLEVHTLNKATTLTVAKNFASALVFAVIGVLYIQMCIQIFDLPGTHPFYYFFMGVGSIIFAVTQFLTALTYNKVQDKLLNQQINEDKQKTLRYVTIGLNVIALIVYSIGVIFFHSFTFLSLVRVIVRTICFVLILLFEPIYMSCFEKKAFYDVTFKKQDIKQN